MQRNKYAMRITKHVQSELYNIYIYIADELNAPLTAANTIDLYREKIQRYFDPPIIRR